MHMAVIVETAEKNLVIAFPSLRLIILRKIILRISVNRIKLTMVYKS